MSEEAPVVELVNNLVAQAVEQRASDIHIEPEQRQFAVRFRIDGVLHARLRLPRDRYNAVASRLKLISGMDIAERRLPQDGRMSTRVGGFGVGTREHDGRSEEHTSELQSLMRISYAVFCLKKNTHKKR